MPRSTSAPVCILLLALLAGCAEPLEIAAPHPGAGKGDLPNAGLFLQDQRRSDRYAAIIGHFADHGFALEVDLARVTAPSWPLKEDRTAVLNRFGTPIRVDYLLDSFGYLHKALDIYRADPGSSDEVTAPVSGVAAVFGSRGEPGHDPERDDATTVAIWDPASHLIFTLLHVRPAPGLVHGFVQVHRGQPIGIMADNLAWLEQRLRHVHAELIDGARGIALDPSRHYPYRDHVPPVAHGVYLLDDTAERHDRLRSGRLDLVVETSDRDDEQDRNFEVDSIGYEVTDDEGRTIREVPRCHVRHLFEAVGSSFVVPTYDFIDFGNARDQTNIGDWPGSDVDNPDRNFRYALTRLQVASDGRCGIDRTGRLQVPDGTQQITVRVSLWDHNDNRTDHAQVISR